MQIAKSKNLAKTRSRREIEPIDLQAPWGSIDVASKIDGTSPWSVKEKLRKGIYVAKKSGRRTIVNLEIVRDHVKSLPNATFRPPLRKGA